MLFCPPLLSAKGGQKSIAHPTGSGHRGLKMSNQPESFIKQIFTRLIDYARDLSYEWSWKRNHSEIHKEEYEELQATINCAKEIEEKLTNIENIGRQNCIFLDKKNKND
jgi:uncharacterized protein (UPF0305 family)